MAKLIFVYGVGKSSEVIQKVYNCTRDNHFNALVINAKGNEIIASNVLDDNGKPVMTCEPNFMVFEDDGNIYEQIRKKIETDDVRCIYVDNAEYLTKGQAEDLFYISKLLDIPVIAYGNRLREDGKESGADRLMEMADEIKKIGFSVFPTRSILQFICGPMNCGKSSKLFIDVLAMKQIGMNVRIIKPTLDRTEKCILSRTGLSLKADLLVKNDDAIYGTIKRMVEDEKINCLFVDEAQFLSKEQIAQLRRASADFGLLIYCYGLRTDFETKAFSGSKPLLQIADEITLLSTMCECGEEAQFNARYFDGVVVKPGEGEQLAVDNDPRLSYKPMCPYCCINNVIGTEGRSRTLKPVVDVSLQ